MMSEGGSKKKKETEETVIDISSTSAGPCPVIPEHIQKIMSTIDKLDKSEIDDFTAMGEISGILKERKHARLETLKKAESLESEESSSESSETL